MSFTKNSLDRDFSISSIDGKTIMRILGCGYCLVSAVSLSYQPLCTGQINTGTATESRTQSPMIGKGRVLGIMAYAPINARTADSLIVLRKNGGDTTMILTIPNSQTGIFRTTADPIEFSDLDLLNLKLPASGGSGAQELFTTVIVEFDA